MPKCYVKTLFQDMKDEDIENIAEKVFMWAEHDEARMVPVPPREEWVPTIKTVKETMCGFHRVRNSEFLEINNEDLNCIRRYNDGDTEQYDIEIVDWHKVSNMEVHKFDNHSKESYCLAMAILISDLTFCGYTYKENQVNQKVEWAWIESVEKKCIKKDRTKDNPWPPKKPGRKKKSLL